MDDLDELKDPREKWFCAKYKDKNSDRLLYINFVKDESMTSHPRFEAELEIIRRRRLPGLPLPVKNSDVFLSKEDRKNLVIVASVGTKVKGVRINWDSMMQKCFTARTAGFNLKEYFSVAYGNSLGFEARDNYEILADTKYMEPDILHHFRSTEASNLSMTWFEHKRETNECIINSHWTWEPSKVTWNENLVEIHRDRFFSVTVKLPIKVESATCSRSNGIQKIVVKGSDSS